MGDALIIINAWYIELIKIKPGLLSFTFVPPFDFPNHPVFPQTINVPFSLIDFGVKVIWQLFEIKWGLEKLSSSN
jgi:hypothetical protein